ncbi:hypothetical protein VSDG_08534 [Cytospora chrysosperma]|uniref:2EXR domain-containing protein n=1 Tax=Cytospora chrysosperma TaxID=252740 RepID=A0A423VFC1_CYTCH|nr:hypothetical protein VSDG_08534 [Valsa sordida]
MATVNFKATKKPLNGSQTTGIFVLPPEIRDKIWKFSLPDDGKIIQARSHRCLKHDPKVNMKYCIITFSLIQQQNKSRKVPVVLQVCAESRAILPFLYGDQPGASRVWWNPAIDKIFLGSDFNPSCLQGREGLCALFRLVVVDISFGAFFFIKLSLQSDMQTVLAQTAARGQLSELIKKLPNMETLSMAPPIRIFVNTRRGIQRRDNTYVSKQDRLRSDLKKLIELASSSNPAAVFHAIKSMNAWMGSRKPAVVRDMKNLEVVPFGPVASWVFPEPGLRLAQNTALQMQHSPSQYYRVCALLVTHNARNWISYDENFSSQRERILNCRHEFTSMIKMAEMLS